MREIYTDCAVSVLADDGDESTGRRKSARMGRPPVGSDGEKVSEYPQVMIRLPRGTKATLDALSGLTGTPIWRLIDQAVAVCPSTRCPTHSASCWPASVSAALTSAAAATNGCASAPSSSRLDASQPPPLGGRQRADVTGDRIGDQRRNRHPGHPAQRIELDLGMTRQPEQHVRRVAAARQPSRRRNRRGHLGHRMSRRAPRAAGLDDIRKLS